MVGSITGTKINKISRIIKWKTQNLAHLHEAKCGKLPAKVLNDCGSMPQKIVQYAEASYT
jgi:hypothetical protein